MIRLKIFKQAEKSLCDVFFKGAFLLCDFFLVAKHLIEDLLLGLVTEHFKVVVDAFVTG
jgi:hypothetical protein